MVSRVRKTISYRDGVGRPDDLAHFKVPPHIRIIEARAHRQHREHGQKDRKHCREGEDLLECIHSPGMGGCLAAELRGCLAAILHGLHPSAK